LNSKALGFAYKIGNPQTGKVFAEIKPSVIKELPVKCTNTSENRSIHDRIVEVVGNILNKRKPDPNANVEALEQEINGLVYSLYNLNSEEIEIIEGPAR
jgi:adenine-specific DNA-methyltransferase